MAGVDFMLIGDIFEALGIGACSDKDFYNR
jgi:hypothetical protein